MKPVLFNGCSHVQLPLHCQVGAAAGDPGVPQQTGEHRVSAPLDHLHLSSSPASLSSDHFLPRLSVCVSQRVVSQWKLLDHHC